MYAVVRLRGNVNIDDVTEDTLEMLNLKDKFNCIVVPENGSYEGMLEKVQKVVTWGKIGDDTLLRLLEKRGRIEGKGKLKDNLDHLNYESVENLIQDFDGKNIKEFGIKIPFKLSPPSKGFKSNLKNLYPQGELGDRGKMDELLNRMI